MDKATDLNNMTKKTHPSFFTRIQWTFGILTFVICAIFWSVIYIAEEQLEVISLHHWLDSEADHYLSEYVRLEDKAPLPNPNEFATYWSEKPPYPNWLKTYRKPGFYEHLLTNKHKHSGWYEALFDIEDKHFLVINHPSGKGVLYIVFKDDADDYLDIHEASLHQIIIIIGAILTLLTILCGVYFVRTISKPFRHIEQKVNLMSPDHDDFTIDTKYQETQNIERALLKNKHNIAHYFMREKEFSQFASHELRTPIMVIQGSTELLEKIPNQPNIAHKAISRLQQAGQEMTILTETFLLLGKQHIEPHHINQHSIDDLLQKQLTLLKELLKKQKIEAHLTTNGANLCSAPESFISVVVNNLIKNAFSYSIDDIKINLENNTLRIINRHDGNQIDNAGYGCGLTIIERICERMNWSFSINHTDMNFIATVVFQQPINQSNKDARHHDE